MIKNKCFLVAFLTITISFSIFGQNLNFSRDIILSTDNEVREIAVLWENYFRHISENNETITSYWADEMSDIVKHAMSSQVPTYRIGNHLTFDIRKLDDTYYEINTLIEFEYEDNSRLVFAIYRVCAKKTNDEFRLYNFFHHRKQQLNSYQIGRINYYYPNSFSFDKERAKKAVVILNDIQKKYRIETDIPITYILAKSLDECNEIIGFRYSRFRSHLKVAGFSIYPPSVILSTRPDHLHELIHALFRPLFPKAPNMLHEGIATFYGGSGGSDYRENLNLLKEFLQDNPNIDLADFYSYDLLINDKFNPFYAVGALIIEHTLSIGDVEKVLELFQYSSMNEAFENVLNVPSSEIHQHIYKLIYKNVKSEN